MDANEMAEIGRDLLNDLAALNEKIEAARATGLRVYAYCPEGEEEGCVPELTVDIRLEPGAT